MLQLFRTNQPYQILLLIGYALLLRADLLLGAPPTEVTGAGLLSAGLFNLLGDQWFWHHLLALALVLGQAILANDMVNHYRMGREMTFVPALCYVLLASGSRELSMLSPTLMANTFLLLALRSLFASYRRKEAMEQLFNVGFWVAIASLFYFSSWVFLILGLLTLSILRKADLRESIVLFSGFLVVYFLLGVGFFWTDQLPMFLNNYILCHFALPSFVGQASLGLLLQGGVIGLLLLWSLANLPTILFKTSIQVQLFLKVLYWAMFVTGLSLFCQGTIAWPHVLMLGMPLSLFFAFNLLALRGRFMAEFIHLVIFMAVVAAQYQHYFFFY